MEQRTQLAGEDNLVISVWGRPIAKTWRDRGTTAYAQGDVIPYPDGAQIPRAALFAVGDREHWYDSAVEQAAHAAWLAATDADRETAISLRVGAPAHAAHAMETLDEDTGLPVGPMEGIGAVHTTTYGTHGAITELEISPASREPFPGRVWLPGIGRWERSRPSGTGGETRKTCYLTHHELFIEPTSVLAGVGTGQRWLCAQVPGTRVWWSLMALSLTTPGHDVVLTEPGGSSWKRDAQEARATAMAATSDQWGWVVSNWGDEARELGLAHAVIVEDEPSPATEQWLCSVFPGVHVSYGLV